MRIKLDAILDLCTQKVIGVDRQIAEVEDTSKMSH